MKNLNNIKYGAVSALKGHLLDGNRISRIEGLILFGVQDPTREISRLKRDGFIIKKQKVSMAKLVRRVNEFTTLKPVKNLPSKNIIMHEWWISKWKGCSLKDKKKY